jgi:hypothetical protein
MAAQMLLGRLACAGEACDSQRRRTAGVSAVVFTGTPQRKGARRAAPPRRLPRCVQLRTRPRLAAVPRRFCVRVLLPAR